MKDKNRELLAIDREIRRCPLCRRGGTGKAVPGEGSAHAKVVLVGEAPGSVEAMTGRPFVGPSGKFLREALRKAGLDEDGLFITSPVHYLPLRGTPTKSMVLHGREHLRKQLAVIDPRLVVLLGGTACLALLGRTVPLAREHGKTVRREDRTFFLTFHPAYAMRFPRGKEAFNRDMARLKRLVRKLTESDLS